MPGQLANLAGLPVGSTFPTLLWLLVHTRRSVWIGLALSGLVGAGLGLLRRQIFSYMRGWQQVIVTIVSLEWLYRLIAGVLMLIGGGLRYFAALSEGEGYLGWLALAGLRMMACLAFTGLLLFYRPSGNLLDAYRAIAILFAIPTAFYIASHTLLGSYQLAQFSAVVGAGYAFLPFVTGQPNSYRRILWYRGSLS